MVELMNRGTLQQHEGAVATPPLRQDFSELEMLRMALNQVDYGLVVVDADSGAVQFANALGRDALEGSAQDAHAEQADNGLRLVRGRVVARRPEDADLLQRTLLRTRAGLRGLLNLGKGAHSASVAVVPLSVPRYPGYTAPTADAAFQPPCLALLMFAKRNLCDDSTMALYARERGLTNAEGLVLAQVCRGMRPAQIADHHGVQISTVRTQLRSIRMKTCCDTLRELVQKVSVLPPMALHLSTGRSAMV